MNNKEPQRVCAIHDLSSFGRCALTVVIPTLSALGIQTVPLPTALMSTHTGGYSEIHIRDLTEDMSAMTEHWKKLGIRFDAIYTGFILSEAQGKIISRIIDDLVGSDTFILVDPVMGDDGQLYSTCTHEMIETMRELSKKADLITPNLTEACLLCSVPYPDKLPLGEKDAKILASRLLSSLLELTGKAAITGIPVSDGEEEYVMTACTERGGEHVFFRQRKVGASYPGTGELFASVLLGLTLDGASLADAASFAGRFVSDTIKLSESSVTERRFGCALEPALMRLSHDIYESNEKKQHL